MPDSISTNELLAMMLDIGKSKEPSFLDKLSEHQEQAIEDAKKSVAMKDSYGNSLLAIGNDDKAEKFENYSFDNNTLNWALWMSLYNDSWVFRRAIDKPAQDEIRCGIDIEGEFDKDFIYKILNKHRSDFIQLLQWGALFGGSIAVMQFDGMTDEESLKRGLDYSKLNKEKILSMKMYVVDRWYGVAQSDEKVEKMTSLDYGKPVYYDVTFADGKTYRVHHSYVLRYEHRTAPKLIKVGQLQGWGYAEGAHIIHEIARDEKLKASIQSLVDKSLIEVIKMSGMRGVFLGADKDNENQLRKRLEMVNWGRSFNSLTFLDKDDEYQEHGFSGLAGLSDLLEKNMWLISAALEMQGVLYGDLKQGFSNDVDALERYDQTINGRCEMYVRPIYEKFLKTLCKGLGIAEEISFSFGSLLMKKQSEERVNDLKSFVDLCSVLLADGVISPQQYAKGLQTYSMKGVIDWGITEQSIDELRDRVNEEMEDIDLNEVKL